MVNFLRKKLVLLLAALMIIGAFGACKRSENENKMSNETERTTESKAGDDVLVISHSLWPPDKIAFLAEELDLYEKYGVEVETIAIDGYDELFELIEGGEVDIWSMTLLDLVTGRAEGEDWQAVLMQDSSAGADGIVVHPDSGIESIADLEGKRVGMEAGTVGQFFLAALLEKEGLSLDDVEAVTVGAEDVPQALMEDRTIDAGVTYESTLSDVVGEGAVLLVDSSKERGLIVDVWVAHESDIENDTERHAKALAAILEAGEFLRDNPEEAAALMHESLQLTEEETIATFDKLRIPDLAENVTRFDRNSGFQSLHTLTRQAVEFLLDEGTITEQADADRILNSAALEYINDEF